MSRELHEAFDRADADDEVRVVVLTGAGRGFCAGGDIKAMAEGRECAETGLEDKAHGLRSKMEVSRLLHEIPKPTIAMVRGAAAGAGLSMALACDLRVAGESAKFQMPFINLAVVPEFGSSCTVPARIGHIRAAELILLGLLFDARRAAPHCASALECTSLSPQ